MNCLIVLDCSQQPEESSSARIMNRFDEELRPQAQSRPASGMPAKESTVAYAPIPHPPPINPSVLTTNPLPQGPSPSVVSATAAAGGKIYTVFFFVFSII